MGTVDNSGAYITKQINIETFNKLGISVEQFEIICHKLDDLQPLLKSPENQSLLIETLKENIELKNQTIENLGQEVDQLNERVKDLFRNNRIADEIKELVSEGRLSDAESLVDQAYEEDRKQERDLAGKAYQRGKIKVLMLKYEEALLCFEKAVLLDSQQFEYLYEAGMSCWLLGRYDEAIGYHERAVSAAAEQSKEGVAYPAKYFDGLGLAWLSKGDNDKAIEYFALAIRNLPESGSEDVYAHLSYCVHFVSAWDVKGYSEFAIQYLEQIIQVGLSGVGEQNPYLALVRRNLGLAWYRQGNYDQAIAYLELALKCDIARYGQKHPVVATDYTNLGVTWKAKGDLEQALQFQKMALEIDLAIYGERHPSISIDRNNLGAVWQAKGDADTALEFVDLALQYGRKSLGENHPDVITARNNIGLIWAEKGDYVQAEDYLKQALGTRNGRSISDIEPKLAAEVLKNLGVLQVENGDAEIGIFNLKKAVSLLSDVGLSVRPYQLQLINALFQHKQYEGAISELKSMLKEDTATLNRYDARVAEDYRLLAKCYLALNDLDSVNVYFNKALEPRFEETVTGSHLKAIELWKQANGKPTEGLMQQVGGLLLFDNVNMVVPTKINNKEINIKESRSHESQNIVSDRYPSVETPIMSRPDLDATGFLSFFYGAIHMYAECLYASDVKKVEEMQSAVDSAHENDSEFLVSYRDQFLSRMKTKNYHALALIHLLGMGLVLLIVVAIMS